MKKYLIPVYVLFLLCLLEIFSRAYLTICFHTPFFRPSKIIYHYYPELRYEVEAPPPSIKKNKFHILLLGSSTFYDYFGEVPQQIKKQFSEKLSRPVKIHTLSVPAHTALDSAIKYSRLADKSYDLVIFYQGINEVRANNCPPEVFCDHYEHYSWYRDVMRIENHPEIDRWSTPFALSYLWDQLLIKLGKIKTLPTHMPPEEWLEYGSNIKSAAVFKRNIEDILELAQRKRENILFMTFAYYVPSNYSRMAFILKKLDYGYTRAAKIETWGKPENVIAGIDAHNQALKEAIQGKNVFFVDQNRLMPKDGKHFNDICHLTPLGCQVFVKNIIDSLPAGFFERYASQPAKAGDG